MKHSATYEIEPKDGLRILDAANDLERNDGIKLLTAAKMMIHRDTVGLQEHPARGFRWEPFYEDMFGDDFLDTPNK